jgi:hypothetical protein
MSLTEGGRTFGTTTGNLKQLVVAVDENAATLPDVSAEREAVVSALADADEAARRKTFHGVQRTQATLDVNAALERGLEAGVRLQNAVRFKLGKKDEKLAEFQVKPQHKRKPAAKRISTAERLKAFEEQLAATNEQLAAANAKLAALGGFKAQTGGDTPA